MADTPPTSLYFLHRAVPGISLSGVLLYWASRKVSFSLTGLQGKELHSMSLAIALGTAPYLMLLPLG